ncbi:MAG: hypothetical protein FWD68_20125 [Alphaproteobacteria bacterium]|nr:hypothetical protein [Alphaproteobacteria bacterium]
MVLIFRSPQASKAKEMPRGQKDIASGSVRRGKSPPVAQPVAGLVGFSREISMQKDAG